MQNGKGHKRAALVKRFEVTCKVSFFYYFHSKITKFQNQYDLIAFKYDLLGLLFFYQLFDFVSISC